MWHDFIVHPWWLAILGFCELPHTACHAIHVSREMGKPLVPTIGNETYMPSRQDYFLCSNWPCLFESRSSCNHAVGSSNVCAVLFFVLWGGRNHVFRCSDYSNLNHLNSTVTCYIVVGAILPLTPDWERRRIFRLISLSSSSIFDAKRNSTRQCLAIVVPHKKPFDFHSFHRLLLCYSKRQTGSTLLFIQHLFVRYLGLNSFFCLDETEKRISRTT